MGNTIKVPLLGETKKPVVIAIAAGGTAVVGFMLYRQHANNATANTAAASSPDASSSDSGTDPQTGLPYGSAEDEQALAQMNGGEAGYNTDPYGVPAASAGTAITTNPEWDAQAQENLEALGYSATSVATALALYLAHQPLSSSQAAMLQIAIAETGEPPSGTYSIIPASGSGTPPTGSGTPAVTVPNVKGMRANAAISKLQSAGLQYHANIDRNPADEYVVSSQTPGPGDRVAKGSTIDLAFSQIK